MKRLLTSDADADADANANANANALDSSYATIELTVSVAPGADISDIVKLVKNRLSGDLISVKDIDVLDYTESEIVGSELLDGCDKETIVSVINELKAKDSNRYKGLIVRKDNTIKVTEDRSYDSWQVYRKGQVIATIDENDSIYSIRAKLKKGTR